MSEIIYKIPDEWEKLAELDESADYEVDITAIYYYGNKFILATASGCSCWDGDYSIEKFDSLAELKKSLYEDDESRQFNPSYKGITDLLKEAGENYSKL